MVRITSLTCSMTWMAVSAVEGAVGERIGEAVQVGEHVGAAGGIAVDADGAGLLVDAAADVEDARWWQDSRIASDRRPGNSGGYPLGAT